MTDEIIQVRHLNKKFGDKVVLKDINLTIPKNKVTVVLGPSGSGKSTLIRTFNGLESFDSRDLEIFGQKIDPHDKKAFSVIKHEIGMVFQSYDLFPNRTVMQNITLGPLKVQQRNEKEVLG
ncbi:ABC-type polar amino acid transport system [Fructobacillus cardui]|nr:ABC-type polar amino acid transport system [Fructobacillus cardui]